MASLKEVYDFAGVSEPTVKYLEARGMVNINLLSRMAKDEDSLEADIIKPYVAGMQIKEVMYKAEEDPILVRSSITVAWEEARKRRDAELAPTRVQAITPVSTTTDLTNSSESGLNKYKLLAGQWQKQVEAYENKLTPKRIFQ